MQGSGREAFQRFAQQLQRSRVATGGGFPGGSQGAIGGVGVTVALIGGALLLNNALFNGNDDPSCIRRESDLLEQWMEVIGLSSTRGKHDYLHKSSKSQRIPITPFYQILRYKRRNLQRGHAFLGEFTTSSISLFAKSRAAPMVRKGCRL